jgi:hypothetical protein
MYHLFEKIMYGIHNGIQSYTKHLASLSLNINTGLFDIVIPSHIL